MISEEALDTYRKQGFEPFFFFFLVCVCVCVSMKVTYRPRNDASDIHNTRPQ